MLHIDDEPGFLELVKFFLGREGDFEVESALDGKTGLELLRSKEFDIAVLDYRLPDINGIEILKILRAQGNSLPVILFTGRGDEEVAMQALNNGADFYLQKGLNPKLQFAELAHIIRQSTMARRAEQAVHEGERFLSSVFSSIQDGISVLDRDLTVVKVNHAMEDWYSHAMPLVGKKCYEAYHGRHSPCDICPSKRTIMTGRADREIVPKVGHGGKVVGWLDLYSFPLIDERTRQLSGVIEYVRDISDQRRAEEALSVREAQYDEFLASLHEIAFCCDTDFNPIFIKGAVEEITGYSEHEFMSGAVKWRQIIHPEDLKETEADAERLRTTPNYLADHNYRIFTKDGRMRWVNEVMRSVSIEGGTPSRILGTIRDITDSKRYEDALEQANAKLNLLGHVTRHDALNELSVLLGWLQLAQDLAKAPPMEEYLVNMKVAADTTRRHLEFAGEYQRMGVARPEWIDVGEALARAMSESSPKGITVSAAVDGLEIFADPLLGKVFGNLIENTVRHGERATRITIHHAKTKDALVLIYEDDGVGIPAEEKAKVFKRGYGKHTGFGLFMAREILGITGISIDETGGHGKGARFEITVSKENYRVRRE